MKKANIFFGLGFSSVIIVIIILIIVSLAYLFVKVNQTTKVIDRLPIVGGNGSVSLALSDGKTVTQEMTGGLWIAPSTLTNISSLTYNLSETDKKYNTIKIRIATRPTINSDFYIRINNITNPIYYTTYNWQHWPGEGGNIYSMFNSLSDQNKWKMNDGGSVVKAIQPDGNVIFEVTLPYSQSKNFKRQMKSFMYLNAQEKYNGTNTGTINDTTPISSFTLFFDPTALFVQPILQVSFEDVI